MRNQIDRVLSAVPFTLRVIFFGRVRPGFPPFQPKLLEADEKNGQKFLEAQLIPPLEAPTLPCFELPTRNCFQCFLLPASRRFWKHSEASSEAIPPRPGLYPWFNTQRISQAESQLIQDPLSDIFCTFPIV